ncbi:MAG TPA: hypothetical protein VKN99_08405 [Polyangia bacterium]|nr:hypothetical protein [Polyangia bacterium]
MRRAEGRLDTRRERGSVTALALVWASVLTALALGLFVLGRRAAQMQALRQGTDAAAMGAGYLVRDDSYGISPSQLDGAAQRLVASYFGGSFAARAARPRDFSPTYALSEVAVAPSLPGARVPALSGRAFIHQQRLTMARYETITVLGPPDRFGRRTSRTVQVSCTLRPALRPDALPADEQDGAPPSLARRDSGTGAEAALARVGSSSAVRSQGGAYVISAGVVELSLAQCRDLEAGRIQIWARFGRPLLSRPRLGGTP